MCWGPMYGSEWRIACAGAQCMGVNGECVRWGPMYGSEWRIACAGAQCMGVNGELRVLGPNVWE